MPDSRPPRIRHTALRVRDLERSIDFYTRVLGMELTRIRESEARQHKAAYVAYGGEADAHALELVEDYAQPDDFSLGNLYWHINISVSDLTPLCEKLRAEGVPFTEEPAPSDGHPEYSIAFVLDPDGYEIELTDIP